MADPTITTGDRANIPNAGEGGVLRMESLDLNAMQDLPADALSKSLGGLLGESSGILSGCTFDTSACIPASAVVTIV